MPDEHYENSKLAAIYDRFCGWSPDRDFYLALAGDPPQHILDLGCGTGLLCDAYAVRGHVVTGADPTPALLAVARVSFEQRFAFPDETLVSFSELRFLPREAIEARLTAVGLEVEALYGDWDSSPFDPTSSHEMIFVARPAER